MKILPFIPAALTALLPYISQKTGLSERHGFRLKMLTAFMYLITGAISSVAVNKASAYSFMVLGALAMGLLGDFFLEYKSKKFFHLGMAFFALGHICYSYTFLCLGAYNALSYVKAVIGVTLLLSASIIIFALTKLSLPGKKKLVLVYAPVLIFAFFCAFVKGVMAVRDGSLFYGICLIFGGILFFASDIMIGIGKGGIKRPEFLHHAVSYTYFPAQALFALSIYFQ